ncbi:MAG TPA: class I SAM-dependent methyltransferase [Steroidobacteraceae bacterium]|nr:class I SAM-dependent methyltransferase [Steroidobacteraceae bacterium]
MTLRMTFKDHFSRLASEYSAFRPDYPAALFGYLAGLCREHRAAWDCACGSGQASAGLAAHFEQVIATDASAQQVAAAAAHPRITYRVAAAEHSGIESDSVDLVTVAQALHWFDLDAFYAEVRRVLRSSGILACWTYGVLRVEGHAIDDLVREFYTDIVGPYWPPERRLVDEGYRELSFPFPELDAPALQMQERWDRPHLLGYLRTWSGTARYVEQVGRDPVEDLGKRLASFWPDSHSDRLIRWPLALRVGRKA